MTNVKTTMLLAVATLLICGVGAGIVYSLETGNAPQSAHQTTRPASQPADTNTPNGAIVDAMNAFLAGDIDALMYTFEPLTVEQEAALRQAARPMVAQRNVRMALADKFGEEQSQRVMQAIGIDPPRATVSAMKLVRPTIDGDRARLTLPRIGDLNFVKVDDTWKVAADTVKGMAGFSSQFGPAAPGFDQIAAEINAGKYQNIEQARQDLQKLIRTSRDSDPFPPPDRPRVLGPGATPQETLAAYYWAMITGDETAAIACLQDPSPSRQRVARLNAQVFGAGEQLRAAVAERFGNTAARDTVLQLGLDPGFGKALLDSAPHTFDGDKAEVDLTRTLGTKWSLTKTGGAWRIDPVQDPDRVLPWLTYIHDHNRPLVLQLISDVKAGKYKTIAQLRVKTHAMNEQIKADRDRFVPSTAP